MCFPAQYTNTRFLTRYDEILYKSDPYGNQAQMRPDNGSVVADLTTYKWKDTAWVNKRKPTAEQIA